MILIMCLSDWWKVWLANFIGALLVVAAVYGSGQFHFGQSMLGAMTVKAALGKINLSFVEAFLLGYSVIGWYVWPYGLVFLQRV